MSCGILLSWSISLPFSFYGTESLEGRKQVWSIQPASPGGLWVGMGIVKGSEVATDTLFPGLSLTQCVGMERTEIITPQSGESQREMKVDLFEQ